MSYKTFEEIPFENRAKERLKQIYAVLYYMKRGYVYAKAVKKALESFSGVAGYQTISDKCDRQFAGNVGTFVKWYESGDMLSKLEKKLKLNENDKNIFSDLLGNDVGERSGEGEEETPPETEPPTANEKFSIGNLYFENKEQLTHQITKVLKNGKHIILIGPPGTGKSKLAKEICDSCAKGGYTMTTATSDWSTFDTIGGYMQDESGKLKFSPGVFLKCFHDENDNQINKWLIIDEINRADIDKAFGEMFSALTGDNISLPLTRNGKAIEIIGSPSSGGAGESHQYFIPEDWRIIATMNTFDKTSLYEMSYAFMRRFAFIPVDIPKEINAGLINNYLEKWEIEVNDEITDRLSKIWAIINKYRKIGPAIIEDVYRYVEATENDFTSALIMYVLPQFEGLDEDKLVEFVKEILKEINDENDRLISFVSDYFEIHEDKLIE
jgi:MoxR-like ATPase